MKQRRLPAARRPHQRSPRLRRYAQRQAVEHAEVGPRRVGKYNVLECAAAPCRLQREPQLRRVVAVALGGPLVRYGRLAVDDGEDFYRLGRSADDEGARTRTDSDAVIVSSSMTNLWKSNFRRPTPSP